MYDLLTTEEAATALDVTARRIRQLVASGRIDTMASRPGGAIMVVRASLERYRAHRPKRRGPRRNSTFGGQEKSAPVALDNTSAIR